MNLCQQKGGLLRVCRTVAIDKQKNISVAGLRGFPARTPVARLFHPNHPRAAIARNVSGAVGGAVVGNQDFAEQRPPMRIALSKQAPHHDGNAFGLIASGHDGRGA